MVDYYDEIFIPLERRDQMGFLGRSAWAFLKAPHNYGEGLLQVPMRLSPFVFLFNRKNFNALYHSLSLKKIFGDDRLVRIFRMGRGKRPHVLQEYLDILKTGEEENAAAELDLLIANEFLIPDGVDPYLTLKKKQRERQLTQPHVGLMYLLISNECNLRCKYCSIESLERKPLSFRYSQMRKEHARAAVDLFLNVLDIHTREPRVIYYGGEPLINWETWLDSMTYIREKQAQGLFNGAKVDVSVITNGTLLTEEKVREMKRLAAGGSVSLDGLKRHHDAMRLYRDGKGSWEDAMRGYALMRKHLGACGISCTLGPHNYKDVEEIVEFFVTRLQVSGMGFNILKGHPQGNDIEISADIITKQIIKAYRILRRFGVYEDRIMRKIKSFVNEEPWLHDCGGYGGQIALCADGYIGPCHIAADDHRLSWGHIEDSGLKEEILHGEIMRAWCARSPIRMRACLDCVGLGICGGGCADESHVKYGDIYALDRSFCEHCKVLIDWMFDDMAEKLIGSGALQRKKIARIKAKERS